MKHAVALLIVALVAGLAYAGVDSYNRLASAPSAYRGGPSGSHSAADSGDISSPLRGGLDLRKTWGNPTASVTVAHSSDSATAALMCVLYTQVGTTRTRTGIAQIKTSTAISGPTAVTNGTNQIGKPLSFDTRAATHFELRILNISAGTISFDSVYGYAADPQ